MESSLLITLSSTLFLIEIIICFLIFKRLDKLNVIEKSIALEQERSSIGLNNVLVAQEKQVLNLSHNINQQINSSILAQKNQLDTIHQQLANVSRLNESKMENIRRTLHESISSLQNDNSKKLESIRLTVEEKLHNTLEKRLGDSFKIVSERLEMVYKGLGEMQNLASGVGDLKKVLSNVKTRGIWGEVQLDAILQQIMTPDQYVANVAIKKNSQDRVEYAIKLPGRDDDSIVLLPIDAKFPLDDYYRLIEAQESCDLVEIEKQSKLLEANIKKCAKTIFEKYINPPVTTDFAIMFLPIEGLYAEVLRRIGMIELLQREYRIVITSPTTLCAILNSLQMGFKTIAIEKHTSNVWRVLESIKPEFAKFADLLSKTKAKLDQAGQAISDAEVRTRMIRRKLEKAAEPIAKESDKQPSFLESQT